MGCSYSVRCLWVPSGLRAVVSISLRSTNNSLGADVGQTYRWQPPSPASNMTGLCPTSVLYGTSCCVLYQQARENWYKAQSTAPRWADVGTGSCTPSIMPCAHGAGEGQKQHGSASTNTVVHNALWNPVTQPRQQVFSGSEREGASL